MQSLHMWSCRKQRRILQIMTHTNVRKHLLLSESDWRRFLPNVCKTDTTEQKTQTAPCCLSSSEQSLSDLTDQSQLCKRAPYELGGKA